MNSKIVLFLTLLIISVVNSQPIPLETGIYKITEISMNITREGFVSVEESVVVSLNETQASILLLQNIQDLTILDSSGNTLQYDSEIFDNKRLVTFYLREPQKDQSEIRISYGTQHLTSKIANVWRIEFCSTATPRYTIVKINFPGNTRITSLEPNDLFWTPFADSLWLYPQLSNFCFNSTYRYGNGDNLIIPKPSTTTTTTLPSEPLPTDNTPYITVILLVFVVALLSFIYKKKSKKVTIEQESRQEVKDTNPEKKERRVNPSIINMLNENEKKIVDMLEKHDEEITQAYIYKTTGIPKASLSDIMKKLEQRNIIYRKKDGRIKWITLKEWVFD